MTHMRRVVKLGGSLLDLPDLSARLTTWLAMQPPAVNVLLVGGGDLADAIRRLDRLHGIGEAPAHWLCVRAMSLTAAAVQALLPDSRLLSSWGELSGATNCLPTLVADAWPLLRAAPLRPAPSLPENWSVTSDSIAVWLAGQLDAAELVLLKSCAPPGRSYAELARCNYVDGHFPSVAASIGKVRLVNFRNPAAATA